MNYPTNGPGRIGFPYVGNIRYPFLLYTPTNIKFNKYLKVKIKTFASVPLRAPLQSPLPWDSSSVGIPGELTTSSPTPSHGIGDRTVAHKL